MRIVISTPTGNIGRAATERLLDEDIDLVIVHRDPHKVEGFEARGATVHQSSLDDDSSLRRATEGADALLWVTPLDPRATALRQAQNDFGVAGAAAIRANEIPRVVNVSSIGAQHDEGTGPPAGLHDVEEMFDATGAAVCHLRPAYFFENYIPQAQVIQAMGGIMLPIDADVSTPMIATADIAAAAVDRLLDDSWSSSSILGLHGPCDLTFEDAAEEISDGIGRRVTHSQVDQMQARMGLSMLGLSASVIDALLELYHAIETGHLAAAEERTDETTTPTTLAEWAAEYMAPLLS